MSTSLTRLRAFYNDLELKSFLRVMIKEEFKGKIALFSSFGANSAYLVKTVAEIDKDIPVLFLDTQKHFPETLEYVNDIASLVGLTNLHMLTPDPKLVENIDKNGDLWQTQVNRCCWLRKVEPLKRKLDELGIEAVITGRRRYQTGDRQALQKIEIDEHDRFRINPFALWDKDRIAEEFEKSGLPQHPLVAKGYLSIGCAPCTSIVAEGEDERSGRWTHSVELYGEQKTECGIHTAESEDYSNWEL